MALVKLCEWVWFVYSSVLFHPTLSRMTPELPFHCWDLLLLHLPRVEKTPSLLQKLGVVRDCLINLLITASQPICHPASECWQPVVWHQGPCFLDYKIYLCQQVRRVWAPCQIQIWVMQICAPKMSLPVRKLLWDFRNMFPLVRYLCL